MAYQVFVSLLEPLLICPIISAFHDKYWLLLLVYNKVCQLVRLLPKEWSWGSAA